MNAQQTAAYEAMKSAEAVFRATRSAEAKSAYDAANAAYNALLPQPKGGPSRGRGNLAGKRQYAEHKARYNLR